ncbi:MULTISPECIES: trp operon repressor [Vibrio]|uniref:Trp operon repressor homolog n=1 Tax=Vibrio proteolyticus NBRC 13287 TaxID=1219065 RepID=U3A2R3_VIBPR|nr:MULTISPECIES: trp operon repressor [Vibrio]NAW58935.1 trp operon repressor [Vibrio sp. V36_P2S2PM302]NAX20955.1 trp operon repressor [Vibrio sp. V39_P1S14PM300]NAX25180.1 trp operon repressor [Vibrio sp. V38_P2S17PM301]NAX28715.1 trp operon repressor [Vibrio sp. V37_P2S8PM304]GAD67637.1 trp operon repressor homolog [Vibrio proteolyticus NBRC 13287]
MSLEPDYTDWQQLMDLVKDAAADDQHTLLLTMMMTPDEREALVARLNIVSELLKGEKSQRQISQMLGVGIATITRGSNELKAKSDTERRQIARLILKQD